MKKFPFLGALATMMLFAACRNERPYTITGEFDIPELLNLGDTIINRPALDGHYVYMLNLDGEILDSCIVAGEKYSFTGSLIKGEEPYFVYIADEYAVGLCVIEPGDIHVMISEEVTAVGTPQNDAITEFNDALQSLENDLYEKMRKAAELNPSLPVDSFMLLNQSQTQAAYDHIVDSVYQADPHSLAAVYVINMKTSQIQLADELQKELDKYDPYIRESQLLQSRMKYLRLLENYYSTSSFVNEAEEQQP